MLYTCVDFDGEATKFGMVERQQEFALSVGELGEVVGAVFGDRLAVDPLGFQGD